MEIVSMRRVFVLVLGLFLFSSSMVGCGDNSVTTDLGAMDPSEDMGMEEENIKPVNVPESEV